MDHCGVFLSLADGEIQRLGAISMHITVGIPIMSNNKSPKRRPLKSLCETHMYVSPHAHTYAVLTRHYAPPFLLIRFSYKYGLIIVISLDYAPPFLAVERARETATAELSVTVSCGLR